MVVGFCAGTLLAAAIGYFQAAIPWMCAAIASQIGGSEAPVGPG